MESAFFLRVFLKQFGFFVVDRVPAPLSKVFVAVDHLASWRLFINVAAENPFMVLPEFPSLDRARSASFSCAHRSANSLASSLLSPVSFPMLVGVNPSAVR